MRLTILTKVLSHLMSPSQETVERGQTAYTVNELETIHAVNRDDWNGLVERSPRSSLFHRYEWLDVVETGLGYPPKHLVVKKDDNLIGLLPNFVRSIDLTPFRRLSSVYPGYAGPLISTDVPETLSLLFETVPDLCNRRTIVHELRANDPDFLRYHGFLRARGYVPYRGECRHRIDLTRDYDEILAEMSDSRQKAIRRGKERDHELVEAELTRENLPRFYRTYVEAMERLDGTVHPRRFFEKLIDIPSRVLFVSLWIEGEYAGSMLELLDDEQSTLFGLIAAVDEDYYEYDAMELLYDYVLQWGAESDYETYDFGDSSPDFEDGLFMYKDSFGGQIVPSLIWERGCSPLWRGVSAARLKYNSYNR